MKNTPIILSLTILLLLAFTLPAVARDYQRGLERQADSYFRMSEKAYRKAVKEYGDDLSTIPLKEKEEACTKIRRALLYNKNNLVSADIFRQNVVKKQIKKLRQYQLDMGCPNSEKDKKKKINVSGSVQIGL